MDDSALKRHGHRLGSIRHSELAQNAFYVVLNRVFGDLEGVADLFVGQSLGDFVQNLDFARREALVGFARCQLPGRSLDRKSVV